MGLDKFENENEELIKYGFLEDIWFHVDKMSSAHVYVRLKKGQTIDDISEGLLEDYAKLVKANSIQGNKVNNIDVVYTPWSNLKKTPSMDVGQVGFYNSKMDRTVRVEGVDRALHLLGLGLILTYNLSLLRGGFCVFTYYAEMLCGDLCEMLKLGWARR
ncbi:hypothetical protein REPUB_Repub18cG0041500 [Reevesia pubescens]